MIPEKKPSLRAEARRLLGAMPASSRRVASFEIRTHLEKWDVWMNALTVCAFVALDSEPNVLSPWPEGKNVILPRVAGADLTLHRVASQSELVPGSFGVLEPAAEAHASDPIADVILVPGLGFDRSGARLGRGRGYYDRLLSGFQGLRVGVCFNESLLQKIPTEPHDERVDFLLTPAGIVFCGPRNKS